MHQPHTLRLSRWARLLGLALLLGVGLLTGSVLASSKAHAQPAATLTVSDCTGESGPGQIGTVISSASAGDTITFSCSGTIPLASTLVISTNNLTLDGSGQSVTLDGGNSVQVLVVNSGVSFTLKALTIADGSAPGSNGGGLDNKGGTVSISNSTFATNSDPTGGGGGLYNDIGGTVSISNSTFATNSSSQGGGGLDNFRGTVSINNSTFATNSANSGGGLVNESGTVSISNSTFATNSANSNGGGLQNLNGMMSISGSIVANNSGGNCSIYGTLTDQGYNLESGSDCGFTAAGDLQNTDPQLDPSGLQNNGGPTQTIALQSTSPAIDQIPVGSNCPATDQRGFLRPDAGETTCDIGAYESGVQPDNDLGLTNLPANITTPATSPQGATVTYTPPTATDESGENPGPAVSCNPASGSTFPIGTTTVTCTASDSDDTPSSVSQSFRVTVQPVLTASGQTVSATEGYVSFDLVATGTAYGTSNPLTATIKWGDGSSSAGRVQLHANGRYIVSGTHTYAEAGSFALTVAVKDSGNLSASGSGSAKVADAALSLTSFVTGQYGQYGYHSVSVTATFTDVDPAGQASDYTASISWGDGTTSTVKVVNKPRGKGFALFGLYGYAKMGTYTLTLTVTDQGGSQVSKTVTVTVKW